MAVDEATHRNGSTPAETTHFDVLIVGAGISGIGAACRLVRSAPSKSFAILEGRENIGGTWDLFRYPGIRSDSDMHTMGFRFKPWIDDNAIAPGGAIMSYLHETVAEHDLLNRIKTGHRVRGASWSSADARWTVDIERLAEGDTIQLTCNFLFACAGYYSYDDPYRPEFPGEAHFPGPVIHPQHWPEDLDYKGKRVVVIGSGATAVTLVPSMAPDAAHVTMLQRSPTYILALPGIDRTARFLKNTLGARASYFLTRWKNVLRIIIFFELSQRRPRIIKAFIRMNLRRHLPAGFDIDKHFKPSYDPWDQRLCVVPDADLFDAVRDGSASIVTDQIESFNERGIALRSGEQLDADIIVSATGLNMVAMGDIELSVDGEPVAIPDRMTYKAMMLSDVPNFAYTVGYTNASWTLKADLTSDYVARLLNHMDGGGFDTCVPMSDPTVTPEPIMSMTSGYVQRSIHKFPKQGSRAPWRLKMSYPYDLAMVRHAAMDDGTLRFSDSRAVAAAPVSAAA